MICPECKTAISQENLFQCLSCSSISHKKCNLYTDSDIKQFHISNCDVCRKEQDKKKVKCELCRKGIGMLKVFNYKSKDCWGHVNCIKWFPKIIQIFSKGFFSYRYDEKFPSSTWTADCSLCNKTSLDFFVKCNKKECNLYAHSKCIINKKCEELHKEKFEFYTFHCREHKKNKENSLGNRFNELKTYGSGLNKERDGNANVMIMIDKENMGMKNNNKEDIILNTTNVLSEIPVKEKQKGSYGSNNNNNVLENIVIQESDKMRLKQKNILSLSATANLINSNQGLNYQEDDYERDFDMITTILHCDFCLEKIYNTIDEVKKCKRCLSVYHIKCENDFHGKSIPHSNKFYKSKSCYKCFITEQYNNISSSSSSSQIHKCIACLGTNGIMLPCNKTWVHYICLKSLNLFFYCKNETKKEYGIDPYKKSKSQSFCSICDSFSQYITKCNKCLLSFHPYCAFKANFDISISKSNSHITFPCCSLHQLYNTVIHKNNHSFLKEVHKLKELPDSAFSQKSMNTSDTIKRQKVGKLTLRKKKLKRLTIDKAITTINYPFLNKQLIQTGLIDPFQIAKTDIFSWDLIDPYYISFESDELKIIFHSDNNTTITTPTNDDEKEKNSLIDNDIKIINLITQSQSEKNSDDNNDIMIIDEETAKESNYFLCQIKQNNKNDFYILYNNKKLKEINIEDYYNSLITNSNNNDPDEIIDLTKPSLPHHFLSKKRHQSHPYSLPVRYTKSFKINALSKKILSLESKHTLNLNYSSNSFIESELKIKQKMLSSITKENNQIISIILSTSNESNKPRESSSQLKAQYKSLFNYQKISKWMMKGFANKTYEDILQLKSSHDNMSNKSLINKKSIVHKQFLDDSECCVCLTLEPEDATDLVFCDKCNVSFHQTCYGIKDIPEGEYLCDLCLKKSSSAIDNIKCILCNNSKGAMKEIRDNQWAHVICIFLSEQMTFKDYSLMKEIEFFSDETLLSHKEIICQACKGNNGEIKQCNCCMHFYHFFCAYFEGYDMIIEDNKKICNMKKMTYQIKKCVNDSEWNLMNRNEQCEIRKLIYQKKIKN